MRPANTAGKRQTSPCKAGVVSCKVGAGQKPHCGGSASTRTPVPAAHGRWVRVVQVLSSSDGFEVCPFISSAGYVIARGK